MDNAVQSSVDMAMTQSSSPSAAVTSALRGGVNVDKAAQDFEAMFMTQMLQPMFEGLSADPTFGGGHGEDVMKTFMLQEYGKLIAKSGQIGIASSVKSEMLKAQSADNKKSFPVKGNPYASVQ